MSKSILDEAVQTLFGTTQHRSGKTVGLTFVEYLLESSHEGWEGVPSRDKASIARLLQDFNTYLNNNADSRFGYVFTGSTYLTTDRGE